MSADAIHEFADIYALVFGERLTYDEAKAKAVNLLKLIKLLNNTRRDDATS